MSFLYLICYCFLIPLLIRSQLTTSSGESAKKGNGVFNLIEFNIEVIAVRQDNKDLDECRRMPCHIPSLLKVERGEAMGRMQARISVGSSIVAIAIGFLMLGEIFL